MHEIARFDLRLAILISVSIVGGVIAGAPTAMAAPKCFGEPATIVGTPGKDTIKGTSGPDVIVGLGGADTVFGRSGKDHICGNGGADVLDGQGSLGFVKGGAANDVVINRGGNGTVLRGNGGHDYLLGGSSRDKVVGGPGDDVTRGRGGPDTVLGGKGFDVLLGEDGDDLIDGGAGPLDRVVFATLFSPVVVDLAAGTASGQGHDTISNVEDIEGSPEGDTLRGDAGPNFIFGLGGDDLMDGRQGFDLALYGGHSQSVNADLSTGIATGQGTDTLLDFEGLGGTAHNDVLTGDANQNDIYGRGGPDDLFGNEEDDYLHGGKDFDSGDGGPNGASGDTCVAIEDRRDCELTKLPARTAGASSLAAGVNAAPARRMHASSL